MIPTKEVALVRVHYLGEREISVKGLVTPQRYLFGPDRMYAYVWEDDLPKFVPEKGIGSPLFEVAKRG